MRLRTALDLLAMCFRLRPVSSSWGFDRGNPVDRFFIERFLDEHRQDVRGRVLEVKDGAYTRRYGTAVTSSDVLDVDPGNPEATVIADLSAADAIPADHYDCVILTQVLGLVYDVPAAIRHAHRILRPGGVLLATLPSAGRLETGLVNGGDWWRFTPAVCTRLFESTFGGKNVAVQGHGNVALCIAFLAALSWEELPRRFLRENDPYHPLVVTVRAVKGAGGSACISR